MTATLLIDGRSGSGKTELATQLARETGAQLVRMDALYPGWRGLAAGSALVTAMLTTGRWQRWDWEHSQPAEWHEVDLSRPLIVEGCGALTAANRALASRGIWLTLDAATRKQRALARDGDTYEPHWDEWAAQEDAFILRENPAALADDRVDGHASFAAEWPATSADHGDRHAVIPEGSPARSTDRGDGHPSFAAGQPATSTPLDRFARWRALLDPARVEP